MAGRLAHRCERTPDGFFYGGASQGLGETLRVGGVSGTASLSLPLPLTDVGRATLALALTYDSGTGNGPFGLGVRPALARTRLIRHACGSRTWTVQARPT
ncbi:SpvB/TcaC N-terminal domain-containing protein [Mycetohabitans sp. B46]|uniref:SpvB/TcaC N-terminal domain-containing protein n=1 Tax=Mycetohabitans sp. B46 TaxID=2772536 RepID=UPI0030B57803